MNEFADKKEKTGNVYNRIFTNSAYYIKFNDIGRIY